MSSSFRTLIIVSKKRSSFEGLEHHKIQKIRQNEILVFFSFFYLSHLGSFRVQTFSNTSDVCALQIDIIFPRVYNLFILIFANRDGKKGWHLCDDIFVLISYAHNVFCLAFRETKKKKIYKAKKLIFYINQLRYTSEVFETIAHTNCTCIHNENKK